MDSDRVGLRGAIELPWKGAVAALRKVLFSSRKVALTAKKQANYS